MFLCENSRLQILIKLYEKISFEESGFKAIPIWENGFYGRTESDQSVAVTTII